METRRIDKEEFMERWKEHVMEKKRIERYLTMRHNDDRLRRVLKKRRKS